MKRIPGIIGIITGVSVLLSALWMAAPYLREPMWYSNYAFWLLALLVAIVSIAICLTGVGAIRKPNKLNLEASAWISALFATSAVRVIFIEKIESHAARLAGGALSAALIFLVFYVLLKRTRNENGA